MSLNDILSSYFDTRDWGLDALEALWHDPASYTLPKDNYGSWETDKRDHDIGLQTQLALGLWHLESIVSGLDTPAKRALLANPQPVSIFENIETLWERLYGKPRNYVTPRTLTSEQEQQALKAHDEFERAQLVQWATQFDLSDIQNIDTAHAVAMSSAGSVLALQFAGGNRNLKEATQESPAYFALFKNHESAQAFFSVWVENDTLVLHGLDPAENETPDTLFAYFLNQARQMGLKFGFYINGFFKNDMLAQYTDGLDIKIIRLEKRNNPFNSFEDDPQFYDRFVIVEMKTEPVTAKQKIEIPSLNELIVLTKREGGQRELIQAGFARNYPPLHRVLLRLYEELTAGDLIINQSDHGNEIWYKTHLNGVAASKIFIPALLLALKLKGQVIAVSPWQASHPAPVKVKLTGRISGIASHAMVLEGRVEETQTPVAVRLDFYDKQRSDKLPWENQKPILKKMAELMDKLGLGFVHYYGDGFLPVDQSIIEAGDTLLKPYTPVVITNWAPGFHHRNWINSRENEGKFAKLMHQYLYHLAYITKEGLVPRDTQFMVDDQGQIHWIDFEEWKEHNAPPNCKVLARFICSSL